MKARESGMPDAASWESFFDAQGVLDRLQGAQADRCDVLEFGCGYGTFTLPAAQRARGVVTALDIEPELVKMVQRRAQGLGLTNVRAELLDFVEHGCGARDSSQSHVMIFNLLHIEVPLALLQEAHRALRPSGVLEVIHWRSDIETPRGPPLSIRPTPRQCADWALQAGFEHVEHVALGPCAPYHFGLRAKKA